MKLNTAQSQEAAQAESRLTQAHKPINTTVPTKRSAWTSGVVWVWLSEYKCTWTFHMSCITGASKPSYMPHFHQHGIRAGLVLTWCFLRTCPPVSKMNADGSESTPFFWIYFHLFRILSSYKLPNQKKKKKIQSMSLLPVSTFSIKAPLPVCK